MVITVGLLGNPNVGKTSLFNKLVGARQYVANWPGVTVSRIEGATSFREYTLHVVDLPGIYSLAATSVDEKVTRDYLLYSPPNVTAVVIDSMSPEQGIFLLLEAFELGLNVIAVFNAIDEARKSGIKMDKSSLEKFLRVPVVLTSAHTGEGMDELKEKIVGSFKKSVRPLVIDYGNETEDYIKQIEECVEDSYNKRFAAIKIIEGDKFAGSFLKKECKENLINSIPQEIRTSIPLTKYRYVTNVIQLCTQKNEEALTVTEALDHVLTHKYIGIPIFLSLMYLAFNFTFKVSEPLVGLMEFFFEKLADTIGNETLITSLLSQGIISGVGSVLAFVPSIFALFFALGIMEESGYLPRIAFLVDKLMYSLRLTGRSFMTLLLGFGCNVSTVMAARGLSDERERITTILVSPFISCSARIPVYLLIVSVAFPTRKAEAFFAIYALSITLTAFSSRIVNKIVLKGQNVPLVMELPRYRFPKLSNVFAYMWNRGKHFLEKAGTIIFVASILIWVLTYFPSHGNVEESYVAMFGKLIQPIFAPLGFTWQIVSALIFGGVAKEVIVSALSQFHKSASNISIDPATAAALMTFILGYTPCFATIAAIRSETNSRKYTFFAIFYSLGISYLLSLIVYTVGRLIV